MSIVNPSDAPVVELSVDTVAALRLLPGGIFKDILVNGTSAAGDGGGGIFRWNSIDVTADNGTTIIAPAAGGIGRWNLLIPATAPPFTFPITIAQGGTGAATATAARTSLGVPAGSGTSTGTNTGDQTAATVNFTPSGAGAVARTVQSKERDVVSVKDFGAVGDGVTDDTAAINAALTFARTSGAGGALRRRIYTGEGVFLVAGALDFSDISVIGSGIFASTFKLKDSAGAVGQVIKISGGRARYENFSIDGNLANNSGQNQAGIEVIGGAFWNSYDTIYITGTTGDALKFTLSGGLRPSMHLFTNFQCSNINRSGIRIDAGRNLTFINADVESVGLLASGNPGIYISATGEAARRITFDSPWIETVGTTLASSDAIRIDGGDSVIVRNGNLSNYGLAAGGGGHGVNISPSVASDEVEIDNCTIGGRAASQSGGRLIRINATGLRTLLKNMELTANDLEDDLVNSANGTKQINVNGEFRTPNLVLTGAGTVKAINNAGTGTQQLLTRANGVDNDEVEIGTQSRAFHGWVHRIAAASAPVAGAAMDGKFYIDLTNHRIIWYDSGNRYFVAGTAF